MEVFHAVWVSYSQQPPPQQHHHHGQNGMMGVENQAWVDNLARPGGDLIEASSARTSAFLSSTAAAASPDRPPSSHPFTSACVLLQPELEFGESPGSSHYRRPARIIAESAQCGRVAGADAAACPVLRPAWRHYLRRGRWEPFQRVNCPYRGTPPGS
ncbi:hypothetical protein BV898_09254 [Hypsibius exemplaris]|uniref:Uncharacterized protein n=1 Tax=Hypsibius exemplaris TaxID=2072580 RepID=A0A1W0WN24_HYPEX|nr:hypothetical protein BV898_09254 [Hypsibius exemplaris]